ncbi:MAG: ROK family protein [Pirellulales bacterium]|nr:ROK family protein [Pirellulales bacterium]
MSEVHEFLPLDRARAPFFVGVDLGGTNIKAGVVDDLGRILSWHQTLTHVERGPEAGARRIAAAIHKAIRDAGLQLSQIDGVGLGSPGTMDIPGGRLMVPANLKGWDYFPIRDRVAEHAGMPITFANDATAAAYGEFWIGSGRDFHSMILLTLGTGIGCGIVIGELLLDGEHSHGGEFGHTIIDSTPGARICACGQPGHFEAYASATAVTKRTREALDAGRASTLLERIAHGAEVSPKLVAEEAEKGDSLSLDIILETARYLAIGMVNLMHTIDPNGILMGGAMTFGGHDSELGRRFLEETRAEVRRRAYAVCSENTVIDFATLGGDAGFIGAAGIGRADYLKRQLLKS